MDLSFLAVTVYFFITLQRFCQSLHATPSASMALKFTMDYVLVLSMFFEENDVLIFCPAADAAATICVTNEWSNTIVQILNKFSGCQTFASD